MIAEATLEQYVYYLRRVEGDTAQAVQERCAAFTAELAGLLAHVSRLSGQIISLPEWTEEDESDRPSQLILSTGWLDNPAAGRACFAAAYIYGDIYCLQAGYSQPGQSGPEVFVGLRDEAWTPATTAHLLGRSVYLAGIVAADGDNLAGQVLAAYTGRPTGPIQSTRLADGQAGFYGSPGQPYVTALFYPNAQAEAWAGETILNNIAPRLEVYKHKTDRQLAWAEENLPVLAGQEADLLALAERASPGDVAQLRPLVRLYRVYDDNVGLPADRQATTAINLHNLDVVREELPPLADDYLLASERANLGQRQAQLEAALDQADLARRWAEVVIRALLAGAGVERPADLLVEPDEAGRLGRGGFPGALPPFEADIEPPTINAPANISLTGPDVSLLQHVYRGYTQVEVKKKFSGGYSGTRVLLTLPLRANGRRTALRVAKLGPAHELRQERDNYHLYVGDSLPYCATPVEWERYGEQNDQAGLSYLFVGGGALGETMDLEEYYHQAVAARAIDRVVKTLDNLLDTELGQRRYGDYDTGERTFAAEYGRHMVEHLRLSLRPDSPDALWPVEQPPTRANGYRPVEVADIPCRHEAIQPGDLVAIEGMTVGKVRPGAVKLRAEGGIVVSVDLDPNGETARRLALGSVVGVRGAVVYNRRGRLEEIVRAICPGLAPEGARIQLPGVPGTVPNPLQVYPQILRKKMENSRESYVHGDLHLRNVLVDDFGFGRLIDFAKVEERHNLFDLVKLETYVRLMGLAGVEPAFPLRDYVRFEEALAAATLGHKRPTCPKNSHLQAAYQVIGAIREIARPYMADPDFRQEYFSALFLYSLAVLKYYQTDHPQPTRLAFMTAGVLGQYLTPYKDQHGY